MSDRVYHLSELGAGDTVKVRSTASPQTVMSGVVSRVIADPPGIEIQGVPMPFHFPVGPGVAGWEVIDLDTAVLLPVDPGLYIGTNRQIAELTPSGEWLLSGFPVQSADILRSITPLERVTLVSDAAAEVIQTIRTGLGVEAAGPVYDLLNEVGETYGVAPVPAPETAAPEPEVEEPEPLPGSVRAEKE